jgi:hypothetical protein
MQLLKDKGQLDIHPELAQVLQRHLYRPEVGQFTGDVDILRSLLSLMTSSNEAVQTQVSSLVNEICAMGLKAGGKAAQRSALEPLMRAGLLHSLKEYFSHCSALVASDSGSQLFTSREDSWIPRLLALLDLYPQEVLGSTAMDACVMYGQQLEESTGEDVGKNLKEWWYRYVEWVESGSKAPKPRPKGPLFRRQDL